MAELILFPTPELPKAPSDAASLVKAFLSGRAALTLLAYQRDLKNFQLFLGAQTPADAARCLVASSQGEANALANAYKAKLFDEGLSSATINRRLAALRALVKLGRVVGLCAFELEVESLPSEALRDSRGPNKEDLKRLLASLEGKTDAKALRDRALCQLLYGHALRRNEALSMDVEHFEVNAKEIAIRGKGKRSRQVLRLTEKVHQALVDWLKVRGTEAGPLFISLDRASYGHRLSGSGLYWVLQQRGLELGIKIRPHGLRHAAITAALDKTGGDVRAVQKFSRHKSLEMLMVYDDARRDLGHKVAMMLSDDE